MGAAYKLRASTLDSRLKVAEDNFSHEEQISTRRGSSTSGVIFVLYQIIKKDREFNKLIYVAFHDFVILLNENCEEKGYRQQQIVQCNRQPMQRCKVSTRR